jgi:hypothetical protein
MREGETRPDQTGPQVFSWKIKILVVGLMGLVTKTNWLAVNHQSWSNSDRTHTRAVHKEQCKEDWAIERAACRKRNQQADAEVFILCGVVTETFRVLSLFVVMMCYSYSKIESATTDCSDDLLGISNKSTHQSKPASLVTNTLGSMMSRQLTETTAVSFLQGQRLSSSAIHLHPSNLLSIECWGLFVRLKAAREWNSPWSPSNGKVKNTWSYILPHDLR